MVALLLTSDEEHHIYGVSHQMSAEESSLYCKRNQLTFLNHLAAIATPSTEYCWMTKGSYKPHLPAHIYLKIKLDNFLQIFIYQ